MRSSLLLVGVVALLTGCQATIGNMSMGELERERERSFQSQNFGRAVACCDEVLENRSHSPEQAYQATMVRALSWQAQGQTGMALGGFQEAARIAPTAAAPQLYAADLNLKQNRIAAARTNLTQVSTYNMSVDEEAQYYVALGHLLMMEGDYPASGDAYDRAVASATASGNFDLEPLRMQALKGKAAAAFEQTLYPQAYGYYSRYADARLEYGHSLGEEDHYWLAIFAYWTHDYDAARQHASLISPAARARAAESLDDTTFFN